jgi:hypothetical protein
MPLPLPNLDDRRWADLVEEGRALIPRYSRQWTDHNISDPGVTLIELFAWMTESSVYALNRITTAHRHRFLSLLGFAPEPPRPAHTMLALSPAPGTAAFQLPAGVEFVAQTPAGATFPFRTQRNITVSEVRIAAVQVDEGAGPQNRTVEWRNGLPVRAFGGDPRSGMAIYFGFDVIAPKTPVTIALRWDRPGANTTARAAQSMQERSRLIDEAVARSRACRRPIPDIPCPGVAPPAEPARTLPRHHSARVVWEAFTGTWTPLTAVAPPATPNEGEVADDTRSLTLDGLVDINLPSPVVKQTQGAVATPLFYVRCRLVGGAYDAPPTLLDAFANAVPAEQRVPVSQRFTIPAGVTPTGPAPVPGTTTRIRMTTEAASLITALAFDPTAAGLPDVMVLGYEKLAGTAGHLTAVLALAGHGNGRPDQAFVLPGRAVVVDETLAVHSHDGTAWQRWEIRPTFSGSRRSDFHGTVEPTRAVLTVGNGERGRVLPDGHGVFVTMHATAGGAASVASGAALQMRTSAVNALLLEGFPVPVNVLAAMTRVVWPAAAGTDQETVSHAAGRAAETLHAHERLVDLAQHARTTTLDQIDAGRVRELRTPARAVSTLDLERMALDVPGTRVARACAWPDLHARFHCLSAPGSITLVVVPAMPVAMPQPSAGLLRTLKRYLDRRRTVATVVHVVGPTYLSVSVRATVRLRRGAGAADVKQRIERALNAFLDPLKGGPEGFGWPFGRPVYRAEILQLIDGVSGVDHLLELTMSAPGGSPQCGNLTLCPTWLAAAGPHDIRIE